MGRLLEPKQMIGKTIVYTCPMRGSMVCYVVGIRYAIEAGKKIEFEIRIKPKYPSKHRMDGMERWTKPIAVGTKTCKFITIQK